MTTTTARRRTRATATTAGALALTLAVLLTACGSGASTAASSGGVDTSASRGPRTPPGVSGRIAAVTGTTLQVQSDTAQTAVSYTAATPITADVTATLADITAGLCATARPAAGDTTASATTLTATTIALSTPVNGACPNRFGGSGGGRGQRGSAPPSGSAPVPSTGAMPAGAGLGANGLITAVSGNAITVASVPAQGGTGSTATAPTTTDVTAITSSSTTVTKAQPATAAALVVGACVTALGTPDATGAVTATALTLRPPVNGACSSGGGRGGQGQRTTTGA